MKKLLLVLAVGLFTMSSCVQEDSISVNACGCDMEIFDISGKVVGKSIRGLDDYRVKFDDCENDNRIERPVSKFDWDKATVGGSICAKLRNN